MLNLKENENCYAAKTQREIIIELINHDILQDQFFLTGGTALSVFYLHHRRSNDLDFFTLNKTDLSQIDFNLKTIWQDSYNKIKESPNFLSALINDVKIEFVVDPLSNIGEREPYFFSTDKFLIVDTVRNIFSNKFCTLVSRIEPKDFIDFYFINKKLKITLLDNVYNDARKKDAIFEDPPTVGFQIESAINFLQNNPDSFPHVLVEYDIDDFYKFYHDTINWIYHKVDDA